MASGDVALGPVGQSGRCDLALVDELARLQLAAQRLGWSVSVVGADRDLVELLEMVGLADALGASPADRR